MRSSRPSRSGFLGRIGVAYIDYSSRDYIRTVVDWTVIRGREDAETFAAALLQASPTYGWRTSISDAIERARDMIETNDLEGTRRVIDISGDGPNNFGRLVDKVRDETVIRRITINGLPILNENDRYDSRYYLADLDKYYRGCVIGGAGAFMVAAQGFGDFARAIRKKLIFEIAGIAPDRSLLTRVQFRPPGSGYVYEKGCDIGERMRRDAWGDFDDS